MRILVVGGNGMLGHRVWLSARSEHETWVTVRTMLAGHSWAPLFDRERTVEGVTADDPSSFDRALRSSKPDVVVNALGLVKQRPEGSQPGPAFQANCFVPHYLRKRCDALGARLIQFGTDCVFTGERGHYSEDDVPDAVDIYGLTKRLGEVGSPHLTLRVSILGRSLSGREGLLEWFLSRKGPVTGYQRALFSGIVTNVLAETVVRIATESPGLAGLWHVASTPINKYELLLRLGEALDHAVRIVPADQPVVDRTLDDSRFREATQLPRPDWDDMIERLASDSTPYPLLRGVHG